MEEVKSVLERCRVPLEPPDDFSFPFPPYTIQKDFMSNLYKAIEGRKLGIFESPTGTGKSLSIICGCLTWLNDHEQREKNEIERAIEYLDSNSNSKSADWLSDQIRHMENQSLKAHIKKRLDQINRKNEDIQKIKDKAIERAKKKITGLKKHPDNFSIDSNGDFKDDIYEAADEDEDLILQEFVEKECNDDESDTEEDTDEKYIDTKIIFCSRTHSQLSQFISELRKTQFSEDARVAPLASRQSYCINKAVNKLKTVSLINEKCLELQKAGKSKTTVESEYGEKVKKKKNGCGCPAMRGVTELSETLVTKVLDVEDLRVEGEAAGTCPYYAARGAVNNAQVVIVPYNTLLHKSTRQACGLEIENSVIIIDEAHNILETISHIHSTSLSGHQLTYAYSQLTQYKERYEKRFSALNLMYLKQLIYIIGAFIKFIGGQPGSGAEEASNKIVDTRMHSINEFVAAAQIDTFNLFKLSAFCEQSKILQKVSGFTEKYVPLVKPKAKPDASSGIKAFLQGITKSNKPTPEEGNKGAKEEDRLTGQPLIPVLSFLENLTMANNDGRVLVTVGNIVANSSIKFLLLDPAVTVKDIISKARSVILAGGTMEPKGELRERLFVACGAERSRIVEFSCGHVIPPSHILPIALTSGPTGKSFDFSFESRATTITMNELGRVLVNICNTVPAGIVCFFPSYDYEATVYAHLDKHGIIENISKKKKVFREPKKSSDVDAVLTDYAKAINTASGKNGALLFSVVGGKLSEGLNFSDQLGRCVIVVGMPYPNIKSPELQEKMKYLEINVGEGAGREHYEACCMKAVNQSIGRAVRHKGDYATVLLLDRRYASQRVQALLPAWISTSLLTADKFPIALASVIKFFKHHEQSSS